jgi:hypothetical protein
MSILDIILCPWVVLNIQVVLQQCLQQSHIPPSELNLSENVLEQRMIGLNSQLVPVFEIEPPVLHRISVAQ